jgi:hypothetical protein
VPGGPFRFIATRSHSDASSRNCSAAGNHVRTRGLRQLAVLRLFHVLNACRRHTAQQQAGNERGDGAGRRALPCRHLGRRRTGVSVSGLQSSLQSGEARVWSARAAAFHPAAFTFALARQRLCKNRRQPSAAQQSGKRRRASRKASVNRQCSS